MFVFEPRQTSLCCITVYMSKNINVELGYDHIIKFVEYDDVDDSIGSVICIISMYFCMNCFVIFVLGFSACMIN